MNDRRTNDAAILDLHHRLDAQEKLIKELCDIVKASIVLDREHKAALKQMIVLWRGSKIMVPLLLLIVPAMMAIGTWVGEHVR